MSVDIVERLRANRPKQPTRDRFEAADEIERLRADNANLHDSLDYWARLVGHM